MMEPEDYPEDEQQQVARMFVNPLPYIPLVDHIFVPYLDYNTEEIMRRLAETKPRPPQGQDYPHIPSDEDFPWRLMSGETGLGISCRRDLQRGIPCLSFFGEVRIAIDPPADLEYTVPMYGGLLIDQKEFGSLSRFVNSSCDPNCKIAYLWNAAKGYPVLVPLVDIPAGQEITYDYNSSISPGMRKRKCLCGKGDKCRVALDFLRTNEGRYACRFCDKYFKSSFLLYQHILVTHIHGGKIPCHFSGCNCSYKHLSNYYRHMLKKHHKNDPKDFEGTYHEVCGLCHREFNTPTEFMGHVEQCIDMNCPHIPPPTDNYENEDTCAEDEEEAEEAENYDWGQEFIDYQDGAFGYDPAAAATAAQEGATGLDDTSGGCLVDDLGNYLLCELEDELPNLPNPIEALLPSDPPLPIAQAQEDRYYAAGPSHRPLPLPPLAPLPPTPATLPTTTAPQSSLPPAGSNEQCQEELGIPLQNLALSSSLQGSRSLPSPRPNLNAPTGSDAVDLEPQSIMVPIQMIGERLQLVIPLTGLTQQPQQQQQQFAPSAASPLAPPVSLSPRDQNSPSTASSCKSPASSPAKTSKKPSKKSKKVSSRATSTSTEETEDSIAVKNLLAAESQEGDNDTLGGRSPRHVWESRPASNNSASSSSNDSSGGALGFGGAGSYQENSKRLLKETLDENLPEFVDAFLKKTATSTGKSPHKHHAVSHEKAELTQFLKEIEPSMIQNLLTPSSRSSPSPSSASGSSERSSTLASAQREMRDEIRQFIEGDSVLHTEIGGCFSTEASTTPPPPPPETSSASPQKSPAKSGSKATSSKFSSKATSSKSSSSPTLSTSGSSSSSDTSPKTLKLRINDILRRYYASLSASPPRPVPTVPSMPRAKCDCFRAAAKDYLKTLLEDYVKTIIAGYYKDKCNQLIAPAPQGKQKPGKSLKEKVALLQVRLHTVAEEAPAPEGSRDKRRRSSSSTTTTEDDDDGSKKPPPKRDSSSKPSKKRPNNE